MPILCPQIDPYSLEERPAAWAYCAVPNIEFDGKTGTLVYPVYASKTAAYTGGRPLRVVQIPLGRSAEYGSPELISDYVPAQYEQVVIREPGTNGPEDPGEIQMVETAPAQDPVYGEALVIRPATPSLQELIDAHPEVFAALTTIVDGIALTQPEFAGGEIDQ